MLELTSLPAGDPDRLRARNALVATLSASSLFVVFAVISTQDKYFRVHSPWQDDPFDVVVSFTMFLVPMLMAALLVRAQLCRAALPLPTRRFKDLLRCARAALAAVGLTTATDWSAAVLGEHRSQWGPEGRALLGKPAAACGTGLTRMPEHPRGLGEPERVWVTFIDRIRLGG